MRVLCYADDTLVTATGRDFREAARLAEVGTALTVDRMGILGLRVSISKTEVLLFHGPPGDDDQSAGPDEVSGPDPGRTMKLRAALYPTRPEAHQRRCRPRRLLPNVGGPGSVCRRLYAAVVRSMTLYGAPIWVDALTANNRDLLRKPQRVIAVRGIRGYRTVSWTAATLLAGVLPRELKAEVLAEVYAHLLLPRQ
nr:uncharacterized protein LOC113401312 [Vanessa tameamea]